MKAVIVAARRTAIGSFNGSFSDVSAISLGIHAARPVLEGLEGRDVADVIVGNVLQAGLGQNVARQIAVGSGLPHDVPAQTINRVCGSGLQAVVTAAQGVRAGDGHLYLAGGTENMTRAPHLLPAARQGYRLGNAQLLDSILVDGLSDAFSEVHMGITAEEIASRWKLSREEQDAFAFESQQRAARAQQAGAFDAEIVPVEVKTRKGSVTVAHDEFVRPETTLEALAKLRPAFKQDGTVTAGNASGINDGAAMLAVASEDYARAHGLEVLAEIVSYAVLGVDPAIMGIGPARVVPIALQKAGLSLSNIDLFELNEAFAAQSLAVMRDLDLDTERVNRSGGAIALGHPIGASGARVLVTLLHALRREGKEHGVASLCIGGGQGIAVVVRAV
ncbi:acetyl-CoA C-acetyltransferase [Deinobacterium chartae]|uniref:Acetyl-CoA C-acetyltransferase n=1 Tax=Deinobacterium chartae TaxID=521158 RepID=A0A841HY47_9DEIO|nr:acetyl-CoA C-acetyltransferase [Deinobacterium chartae]MBB6097574.1 acetyl-CoA C-acetyltransferase [Deinobacterium chartae]